MKIKELKRYIPYGSLKPLKSKGSTNNSAANLSLENMDYGQPHGEYGIQDNKALKKQSSSSNRKKLNTLS